MSDRDLEEVIKQATTKANIFAKFSREFEKFLDENDARITELFTTDEDFKVIAKELENAFDSVVDALEG